MASTIISILFFLATLSALTTIPAVRSYENIQSLSELELSQDDAPIPSPNQAVNTCSN